MEFLRSLLRRRFARAQVAASRNVGCFLRPLVLKQKGQSVGEGTIFYVVHSKELIYSWLLRRGMQVKADSIKV